MDRMSPLVGVVLVIGMASTAHAQQRFRLTDGLWKPVGEYRTGEAVAGGQDVRRAIAEEDFDKAIELADRWLAQYPNHPNAPDVFLLRGDAKMAKGDYYKSLYDYEAVLRRYPGSRAFNIALEREFTIAHMYATGVKRKLWGMRFVPAGGEAEELFIRIQERAPGSEIGRKASMALADYYYRQAEMESATDAYDLFLLNYPRSEERERAMRRLIESNLATFKGPKFDATGLVEAKARLGDYEAEFPAAAEKMGTDALVVRIEESLAQKMLENAKWYMKKGERVSAAFTLRRLVQRYSTSAAAQEALGELEKMGEPVADLREQAAIQREALRTQSETHPGGDR